ncbi:helix-turn-helix domain-containing protein [Streptomyces sp. NPDC001743]|uniref:helix-turn-helix domain-containing protein n=1 Tax=Streptomyces sp. NPDC001743 TaxID=3154397 RepID=UPI00331FE9CD
MTQSTTGAPAAPPLPPPKERRRLREAKSLTEAQVAAAVGVTPATVRAWETGRTSPRGRKREVYARLIGTAGPGSTTPPSSVKPATPHEPPTPPHWTRGAVAGGVAAAEAEAAAAGSEVTGTEPDGAEAARVGVAAAEVPGAEAGAAGAEARAVDAEAGAAGAGAEAVIGSDVMDPTCSGTAAAPEPAEAEGAVEAERSVGAERTGAAAGAEATDTLGGAEAADMPGGVEAAHNADAADGVGGGAGAGGAEELRLSPAAAFDALYRHSAAALYRQTYLLTGRRALSREAVGKAFELAWQRWPEVAVDRDPVGWVRAAAYEYAMSPWHRWRREHRHPDPPPEAPGARALLDAMLALPPSYRRTLLLYDGVGLGLPETAAETEASTPAAAGRLMTARAALAEQLPELAEPPTPAEQSALLHERLGALALTQPASSLPVPELIRTGSERKAELWTRAAIAFTVLLIGLTLITLATAPRQYETPPSPAQRVEGVPPLGGPQKLTPQDKKLQKKLGGELVRGPARLVPRAG